MKKYTMLIGMFLLLFTITACKSDQGEATKELATSDEYSSEALKESNETVVEGNPETVDEEAATQESEESTESTGASETEEYQDYIDIELTDADGNIMMLSDYEGKFIALNIFGTWCTYCMQEMPDLQAVYDDYEGDDFVILLANATSTEKNEEVVIDWYNNSGYTMPMGMDLKGELMSTYPVQGFPTTVFINKEGKIIGAISGMLDQDTLYYVLETYNK
ncbi:MAG: TlpA family protein disulfide reductase [Vallitaleaceae bacterium]|nr:TlpA family protein disulfide reductase [Vallitaleaceae bacterium]